MVKLGGILLCFSFYKLYFFKITSFRLTKERSFFNFAEQVSTATND